MCSQPGYIWTATPWNGSWATRAWRYFFPLRSYIDAGIHIAGGSDHMIRWDKNTATNPYNPFLGLWTCVTRKTIRGSVIHPEQKITREEALKMYNDLGRRTHVRREVLRLHRDRQARRPRRDRP